MKVREFIEVLKKFDADAELEFGNTVAESDGEHLLGISAEHDYDHEQPMYSYNIVTLCIMPASDTNYDDLIDEEFQLYGNNRVWYNTRDKIVTYKHEKEKVERVNLVFDEETLQFKEV